MARMATHQFRVWRTETALPGPIVVVMVFRDDEGSCVGETVDVRVG